MSDEPEQDVPAAPRPPREQEQDKADDPNAGTLETPREGAEGGDDVGDAVPDA